MEDNSISIKEELVWDGKLPTDEGSLEFSSNIKTEPITNGGHGVLVTDEGPWEMSLNIKTEPPTSLSHGIDQMAQSSYAASINFPHHNSLSPKEEQPVNMKKDQPKFGFVEVDMDRVQSIDFSDVTGVDPLQLTDHPATACEPCEAKQELDYVKVKQDPGKPDSSLMEVSYLSCAGLQSDQGSGAIALCGPLDPNFNCTDAGLTRCVAVCSTPKEESEGKIEWVCECYNDNFHRFKGK